MATAWLRVGDPLGPSDVDPDAVRDRACEVTSPGRVCNPPEPDAPDPPLDPPDVPDAGGAAGFGGVLGQLLVVLLVAALVVAIAWLVMRWLGDAERLGGDDGDDLDDLDEDVDEIVDARIVDEETPPDRWRRLAAAARERTDYRESVRCEYRALVGDLARAGYVDEIPGRTSGEEREQVAELAPDITGEFDVAADTFDEAWFSHRPVTSSDDERFLAAERSVLDAVLTGAGRRVGGRS